MADQSQVQSSDSSVLADPSTMAVARVYAEGLLEAVPAADQSGIVEELKEVVSEITRNQKPFWSLLVSKMLGKDEKLGLVERVFKPRVSTSLYNFLSVVTQRERLELLPEIAQALQLLYEQRSGKRRVQISSAIPLGTDTLRSIQNSLQAALPFEPVIEAAVDPDLVGGLRIRIGDTVYDYSLRSRLKQLRDHLRERSLHEIQSGRNRFSHSE